MELMARAATTMAVAHVVVVMVVTVVLVVGSVAGSAVQNGWIDEAVCSRLLEINKIWVVLKSQLASTERTRAARSAYNEPLCSSMDGASHLSFVSRLCRVF